MRRSETSTPAPTFASLTPGTATASTSRGMGFASASGSTYTGPMASPRLQGALQRHLAGEHRERGIVDGLVLGGEGSLQPREPDRVPHGVGMSIEEADHVGATGLLVDQQQRLLARFGSSSPRRRVEEARVSESSLSTSVRWTSAASALASWA